MRVVLCSFACSFCHYTAIHGDRPFGHHIRCLLKFANLSEALTAVNIWNGTYCWFFLPARSVPQVNPIRYRDVRSLLIRCGAEWNRRSLRCRDRPVCGRLYRDQTGGV